MSKLRGLREDRRPVESQGGGYHEGWLDKVSGSVVGLLFGVVVLSEEARADLYRTAEATKKTRKLASANAAFAICREMELIKL